MTAPRWIVTPEGLPLTYEVLAGNTADCTTLKDFLARIERLYGHFERIWVMDRGFRPRKRWKRCASQQPRCNTWSGHPRVD